MSKLCFGWAEVSITPEKKVLLCGQFAERISQYIEKPVTATALAVDSGEDQIVLVSVDIEGIGYNLVSAVRERMKEKVDSLDPMKAVFFATHSHTAPLYTCHNRTDIYGNSLSFRQLIESELPEDKKYIESADVSDNPDVATPEEMFDFLVERLSEVVLLAWNNRKEGSFCNAFGRAAVGQCRRVVYSDGSAQMWGDTNTAMFSELEGGSDTGIELLYVFDDEETLTGIVANLACPAQCVQHRHFVSPDYWGEAKRLIREHFGENIFLLPVCAPAGDQCPVDLVRWVEPESDVNDPNLKRNYPPKRKADPSMFDLSGMRKAGKRVAREIIDIYESELDEKQNDVKFIHDVKIMQLPVRRTTFTEVDKAHRAIGEYLQKKEGDVDFNDAAVLQVHLGILRRAELQEVMEVLDTEVHIVRLGSVAIATSPFELFLDYGNQIRARANAEQTFLIQLANGAEGYLPTAKAEKGGHYSAFISSGIVGHAGGEQLVRETLKGINRLFVTAD